MKIKDAAEAFAILAKTQPDEWVNAEHDQMWAGQTEGVAPEDAARLKELGWFEEAESWSHFT